MSKFPSNSPFASLLCVVLKRPETARGVDGSTRVLVCNPLAKGCLPGSHTHTEKRPLPTPAERKRYTRHKCIICSRDNTYIVLVNLPNGSHRIPSVPWSSGVGKIYWDFNQITQITTTFVRKWNHCRASDWIFTMASMDNVLWNVYARCILILPESEREKERERVW